MTKALWLVPALTLMITGADAQPCLDFGSGSRLLSTQAASGGRHLTTIHGGRIYQAALTSGGSRLAISNLEASGAIDPLGVWETDQDIWELAVGDGFAFLLTGSSTTVTVLDVRNPAQPLLIPGEDLPGRFTWLDVEDGILFARAGELGEPAEIRAYALEDDGGLFLLGALSVGGATEPVVCDGLVFTYDFALLRILDFTSPAAPVARGTFPIESGEAEHMTRLGDMLYISGDGNGLEIWDIADPDQPAFVDRQFPNDDFSPTFRWLGRSGDHVLGIHDGDVLLTMTQEPTGLLRVDGVLPGAAPSSYRSSDAGGGLFGTVSVWPAHLRLYDLTAAGTVLPLASAEIDGGTRALAARGDRAFATLSTSTGSALASWDLSDPAAPGPARIDLLPIDAEAMVLDGELMATGTSAGELAVYEVDQDATPHHTATVPLSATLSGLDLDSGLAVGVDGAEVFLIDLSTPTAPVPSSYTHAATVMDLDLDADRLAVFGFLDLAVYDVADPAAPVLLGTVPLARGFEGEQPVGTMAEGFAYAAHGDSLGVYATADGPPRRVAAIGLPFSSDPWLFLGWKDSVLYLGNETGVHAVDVTDPATPEILGAFGSIEPSHKYALTGSSLAAVRQLSYNPGASRLTVFPLHCTGAVANEPVPETGPELPGALVPRVLSTHPNPFNPRVDLAFMIPQAGPVTVDVVDLAGRRVAELWHGPLPVGPWQTTWDGRDLRGRSLAAGQYLVRIRTEQGADSRRVTLVR